METQTEEPAPDAPAGDAPAPSEYAGLTVVELREKLRERELPVSGTKAVLLARLAETGAAPATADDPGPDYSKLSRKELKLRRKAINTLAEELRRKRDELNLKSQSHAAERNELNAQAKALMDQVYAHRDRRNGLNVEVGETRDDLRQLGPDVDQLRDEFLKLKRARFAGSHLPPIPKLRRQIQELELKQMTATGRTGNFPQVNSADLWQTLIGRLMQNEYEIDEEFYGDEDQFAEKVAFFFHQSLQGVAAANGAAGVLTAIANSSCRQTLLADAQPFTLVQLLRGLGRDATLPPLGELLDADAMTLSCQLGLRKPSPPLYQACLNRLAEDGIEPGEVLHIGSRLRDDLAVAKQLGMKIALYAGDSSSFKASKEEVRDPDMRPDRLLTELTQVLTVLGID